MLYQRLCSKVSDGRSVEVRTTGGSYAFGWFVEEWQGYRLYSHPDGI